MKLLLGFAQNFDPSQPEGHRQGWGVLGDEVKVFSLVGGDVDYKPGMDFSEILQNLSPFVPDVVVLLSPEYWPIPRNLEKFEGLVVAFIGDWHLNSAGVLAIQHAVDFNFTDRLGVEFLKKWGCQAAYFPLFWHKHNFQGFPVEHKDYDIVFVGNLNPSTELERNTWLYRIARLSRQYNVGIFQGIFGDDYARLLSRSKIVFNRSVRKEMNLRASEVPAAGSLLFMEEDNLEIRDYLEDGKECVLYNSENLEKLLQYYLTNDEKREEIERQGKFRIENLGSYNRLKDAIPSFLKLSKKKGSANTPFHSHDLPLYLCQFFIPTGGPFSLQENQESIDRNNQLAFLARLSMTPHPQFAIFSDYTDKHFAELALRNLDNVVLQFNAGSSLYHHKKIDEAIPYLFRTLELLDHCNSLDADWLLVTPFPSYFSLKWNQTYWEGHSSLCKKQITLLKQEVCLHLGAIFQGKGDVATAEQFYEKGVQLNEGHFLLLKELGKALAISGKWQQAHNVLQKAFEVQPLDFELWNVQLQVLSQVDLTKAKEFLEEKLIVLDAFPQHQYVRAALQNTYSQLVEAIS